MDWNNTGFQKFDPSQSYGYWSGQYPSQYPGASGGQQMLTEDGWYGLHDATKDGKVTDAERDSLHQLGVGDKTIEDHVMLAKAVADAKVNDVERAYLKGVGFTDATIDRAEDAAKKAKAAKAAKADKADTTDKTDDADCTDETDDTSDDSTQVTPGARKALTKAVKDRKITDAERKHLHNMGITDEQIQRQVMLERALSDGRLSSPERAYLKSLGFSAEKLNKAENQASNANGGKGNHATSGHHNGGKNAHGNHNGSGTKGGNNNGGATPPTSGVHHPHHPKAGHHKK